MCHPRTEDTALKAFEIEARWEVTSDRVLTFTHHALLGTFTSIDLFKALWIYSIPISMRLMLMQSRFSLWWNTDTLHMRCRGGEVKTRVVS